MIARNRTTPYSVATPTPGTPFLAGVCEASKVELPGCRLINRIPGTSMENMYIRYGSVAEFITHRALHRVRHDKVTVAVQQNFNFVLEKEKTQRSR